MSYKINEIEGIGPSYSEKLATASINTTDDLLKLCCDSKGRKTVSESTGINSSQLLKWANMADLMRISGVARQNSELLEAAGVDTIKELRTRRADNLTAKIAEINEAKKLAKATPSQDAVQKWIDEAAKMDPLITH